jgi:hypothetical protein
LVFHEVDLPDTLVSDRDPRSSRRLALHVTLGALLIFGLPHELGYKINSRTKRVNGVIADVLQLFVDERQDVQP